MNHLPLYITFVTVLLVSDRQSGYDFFPVPDSNNPTWTLEDAAWQSRASVQYHENFLPVAGGGDYNNCKELPEMNPRAVHDMPFGCMNVQPAGTMPSSGSITVSIVVIWVAAP